jgi:hypothetical protein
MVCLLVAWAASRASAQQTLHVYPSGPIYSFRWDLLELALAHCKGDGAVQLAPYREEITQSRSVALVQSGAIDVIALGINADREASLLPIRIDILKGIIGFRVFLIRAADQGRIARMDVADLRRELTFGLERDWADLPVMVANGFAVETAVRYEDLFRMLSAGRFDAFPRGLNEANRDLEAHRLSYPDLALEPGKAMYFPYPVYFWVSRKNPELAQRIECGLRQALADGSFRKLFLFSFSKEISALKKSPRQVLLLPNPLMPEGTPQPDTSWWWQR